MTNAVMAQNACCLSWLMRVDHVTGQAPVLDVSDWDSIHYFSLLPVFSRLWLRFLHRCHGWCFPSLAVKSVCSFPVVNMVTCFSSHLLIELKNYFVWKTQGQVEASVLFSCVLHLACVRTQRIVCPNNHCDCGQNHVHPCENQN